MIVFTRYSEDYYTIYYKNVSDKPIEVKILGFEPYQKNPTFENILICEPHIEYFTHLGHTNLQGRKILIYDRYTNELLAPFVLDGPNSFMDYEYKNYMFNILSVSDETDKSGILFCIDEHHLQPEYENIIDIEKGDIVVDVGFNFGMYSLRALKKGVKEIWGFEPNRRIYQKLKEHYPDQDRVHLYNFAVSNKNGFARFKEDFGTLGAGICDTQNENDIRDFYDIRTINLYDFLIYHNVHHIDLLKIDCEGTEYDIIESIPDEYFSNIRKIHMEYHINTERRLQNILDKLTRVGFEITFGKNYSIDTWMGMIYCKKNG
jgi:FkbM family methyltransferase